MARTKDWRSGKWRKSGAAASEPLRECIRQLERGGTEWGVIEALSSAADRIDETFDGMARAIKVIAYCAYGSGDCDGCVMNGADEPKITVDETTACDGMSEMLHALGIVNVEKSS